MYQATRPPLAKEFRDFIQTRPSKNGRLLAANSIRCYVADATAFFKYCEQIGIELNALGRNDVIGSLDQKDIRRKTLGRKTHTMKRVLDFLTETGRISHEIDLKGIAEEIETIPELLHRPATDGDFGAMVGQVRKFYSKGSSLASLYWLSRDVTALTLLAYGGISLNNIVGLNEGELTLTEERMSVKFGLKSRVADEVLIVKRNIPRHEDYNEAWALLDTRKTYQDLIGAGSEEALFLNDEGKRISVRHMRRKFARYTKRAKLPEGLSPRSFVETAKVV